MYSTVQHISVATMLNSTEQNTTVENTEVQWYHLNRVTLADSVSRLKVCVGVDVRNSYRGTPRFGEHSITTTTETTGAQRTH